MVVFRIYSSWVIAVVIVVHAQFAIAQPPNFFNHSPSDEPKWHEVTFTIEHAEALIDFSSHESANYRMLTERRDERTIVFRISLLLEAIRPSDAYPYGELGSDYQLFLGPSRYIQSNDPTIVQIARSIRDSSSYQNAYELVMNVLNWNRRHLQWGNPSDLPSALDAYTTRQVNCIGFTHLPAAILRYLGIPARTVRTFIAAPDVNGLVPHYLLEVYFPSINNWVTFDPQTGPPSPSNIVLYTHHDWDFEGQRRTRPLVSDPLVTVWSGE